jgi:hypothetical protein
MPTPRFKITGNGAEVFEEIETLLSGYDSLKDADLSPLVKPGEEVIRNGRARMTKNGTDKDGKPLHPIKDPETVKRRAKAKKGDGPPMAPDLLSSSPYKDFEVKGVPEPGRIIFNLEWPTSPWLAKHAEGIKTRKPQPVKRDVLGVDIQTLDELNQILLVYVSAQYGGFGGKIRQAFKRFGRIFGRNR